MLFLFRGHNGPLVRALVGALLLVTGIAVPGGAFLAGIGAVLLVWGAVGALSARRLSHQSYASSDGRTS
jgi:membrane-bound ClpP family serine protease